jgi:gliding motility-associated-like protein
MRNLERPVRRFLHWLLFCLIITPVDLLHAQAPTEGATNFSISNIDGARFRVNWTRGNGERVLVVASLNSDFGGAGVPSNGVDYNMNTNFGSGDQIGSGNFVVYKGTGSNVTVINLVHSTTYYFRIYEYNGTASATEYNTADVLSGNGTTLFPPTEGASNLGFSNIEGNRAGISWTRGNGTRALVILRANEAPGDPTMYQTYLSSTNFGSGSSVGGGHVVYNNTGESVNVTNLQPNTTYFAKIIEYTGSTDPVYLFSEAITASFTTGTAPVLGNTNFNITNTQGDRLGISFTRGDGSARIVVARRDIPVDWSPVNGVDYNANGTFSLGDQVAADTYIVGRLTGTSSSLTVSGLTPATTYHFAIFEFNGTLTNTYYLTDEAQVLLGSGTTLSPPSTQGGNFVFSNIDGNSASVSFEAGNGDRRIVLARIGDPVEDAPVSLTSYSSNSSWTSAPNLGNSKIVFNGTGTSFNLSNLQPATTYHFAVFEYNGSSGPVYNQNNPGRASFSTAGAPTVAPTNLTYSNIQGNRITLNFNTGDGLGRILIAKKNAPVDAFPQDGISYTANSNFGTASALLGDGNYVIANNTATGTSTSVSVTNLEPDSTYHFAIIEFNGTGEQRLYMQPADALLGNQATLSAPTLQATNLSFSDITPNSVRVSWENGNGNARIVLIRPEVPIESLPSNLSSYLSSSNYSTKYMIGTSQIIFNGTGSTVNVTNIPPGEYHIAVIEYNGSTGPVYRNVDPLRGSVAVGAAPETPASNIGISNRQGDRFTVSFTRGDGINRLAIAKAGSPVDAWPVDGNAYTSSSVFGNGAELGEGNFVVYSGTGNTFTISGLSPSSNYHFAIVEFNGTGTSSFYQDPAIVAKGEASTLSAPTIPTSSFFANNVTGNRMQITWTNGNGDGRLVVARMGEAVNVEPADLSNPFTQSNFGSGTNLGNGNFAVYSGTGDNFVLQSLEPDTTYHLASFEYNGSTGRVYLKEPVGRASFSTAERPSVPARNLNVTNRNGDRVSINMTAGNGTRRLVVFKKQGLVDILPEDLVTYTSGNFGAGSEIGNGNFVVGISTGVNFTIQGLEPDTEYGVAVFEFDGSNGRERYMVSQFLSSTVKTASPPTIPTNALLFNNVGTNSVNLSWTNGNGQGRMVIMRPAQPVTFAPQNLNTHGTTSTNFNLAGNLGDGHRHIYRGTANNINVTNLSPGTTYHVAIYEYNGNSQPVYALAVLTGFFTTPPDNGIALGGFDAITFCPGQTFEAPYLFAGVLNTGNIISIEMSDINGSFADSVLLGQQSTINNQGFVTASLPFDLQEGTGYRIRVRSSSPFQVSADNGADLQIFTSETPAIFTEDEITSTCGDPITLITEQPGYLLQWFRDGTAIPNATSSTYTASASGSYQVRISGAFNGCQLLSDPINLTITPQPAFNLILDEAYCITEPAINLSAALPAGGNFSGPGISDDTFDPILAGIGQHLIEYTYTDNTSGCVYSQNQFVTVLGSPEPPVSEDVTICEGTAATLTASGAEFGDTYFWYNSAGDFLASSLNGSFVTENLSANTTYQVSILSEAGCESFKTTIEANLFDVPAPPAANDVIVCELNIEVTLTASGTSNGNYRWYDAPSGGSSLGEDAEFTTPELTEERSYFVSLISADGCEGERTEVSISLETVTPPAIAVSGETELCENETTILIAEEGYATYRWSNGAETREIEVSEEGTFTVVGISTNGCESEASAEITITNIVCITEPPVIQPTSTTITVGGIVTINLLDFVSDPNNSLDLSSLRVINEQTQRGAPASIDAAYQLIIDYAGIAFTGTDIVLIEACNFAGLCTQQQMFIEVIGEIIVFNALSPNGDGINDTFIIQYIELIPETLNNKVSIYNRWGDVVFEVENYDNVNRVFRGQNMNGNDLPSGTYFYKIEFRSGRPTQTGFISLKR